MNRTKADLEAENRELRLVLGEVYDRVAEQIEPDEPDDDEQDEEYDDDEELN